MRHQPFPVIMKQFILHCMSRISLIRTRRGILKALLEVFSVLYVTKTSPHTSLLSVSIYKYFLWSSVLIREISLYFWGDFWRKCMRVLSGNCPRSGRKRRFDRSSKVTKFNISLTSPRNRTVEKPRGGIKLAGEKRRTAFQNTLYASKFKLSI
jgi:hypothetical protein